MGKSAHQGALAELDLERVVRLRMGVGECSLGGGLRALRVDSFAVEGRLGLFCPPRNGRHAAESNTCLLDRAVLQIEGDGGGGECELIGLAIADLQIERAARPWRGGHRK